MNSFRSKCGTPYSLTIFYRLVNCILLLSAAAIFSGLAAAQDEIPPDAAPPPAKFLSSEEVRLLETDNKDIKKRTKTLLQLMDNRLKAAESSAENQQFDTMFAELGGFHGLMDNAMDFLAASGGKSKKVPKKVLENYKRFEIALRGFAPRLELIRRNAPSTHEFYVRTLLKQLRDARTKATDPFYGDTVLSDGKP